MEWAFAVPFKVTKWSTMYDILVPERYIEVINNKQYMESLCKLRTSGHCLEIEHDSVFLGTTNTVSFVKQNTNFVLKMKYIKFEN